MTQPMHTYLPTSNEEYPTRRCWKRLGSMLALTGYMGQLACQVVLASGFCLSHSSPVQAMDMEIDGEQGSEKGKEPTENPERVHQLFTPNMNEWEQGYIIEALGAIKEKLEQQRMIDSAKSLFAEDMNGFARGSIIDALRKIKEPERQGVINSAQHLFTPDMGGFGKASIIDALGAIKESERQSTIDSAKPLFTSDMGGYGKAAIINRIAHSLSSQAMENEIPPQKGESSGSSRGSLSSSEQAAPMDRKQESEKGKETSESSGARSEKFYQDDNHPLTQGFWRGKDLSGRLKIIWPAIGNLRDRMESEGYLTKKPEDFSEEDWGNYIKVFEECTGRTFQELFACPQCDANPVKELEDVHYGREIFTGMDLELMSPGEAEGSKETKGYSGNDVITLVTPNSPKVNLAAIKKFTNREKKPHKIEEGLKELLDSLFAHTVNPNPSILKMTRLYDAFLCPENSFCLMMEGANTHDIDQYLVKGSAIYAVRALGQYLAMFHIDNYRTQEIITDDYISHKGEAFNKLSDNPLADGGIELLSRAGKQEANIENVTAANIIRLFPEDKQKRFEGLVDLTRTAFEGNCGKIFRSLNNKGAKKFYFLTKTHGDAHGNNFFYREEEELPHNGEPVERDSFYRISMIDFASMVRTYNGIGDPAEDVGRFLGFLWKWAARTQNEQLTDYERMRWLQKEFLNSYLGGVAKEMVRWDTDPRHFERTLRENANFYKLRYYKAIFNSPNNKESRETKLKVLESWLREHEGVELPVYDAKGAASPERPWKEVRGRVIHNRFPKKVEGFIESGSRASEEKSYLTRLWTKFNTFGLGQATLLSSVSSGIAVAGMGGIGKSSLALQYVHEALDKRGYNLIYWLLSETDTSLLNGYQELARDIDIQEDFCQRTESINEIVRRIEAKELPEQAKWLLVYDNVPEPNFLRGKVPQKGNIDVLVTSRWNKNWEVGPVINLGLFNEEEATQYLAGIIYKGHKSEQLEDALRKLANALGCFPLALSHAAHYLRFVNGENIPVEAIDEYIEDLNDRPLENHFDPQKLSYENLIEKTFDIWNKNEDIHEDKHIHELAKKLIVYCAYLNSDSISENIFLKKTEKRNQEETKKAMEELCNLSLLKKIGNKVEDIVEDNSFSMHRLVQKAITDKEIKSRGVKTLLEISRRIETLFYEHVKDNGKFANILTFLPHVISLLNHYPKQEEEEKQGEEQKKKPRKRKRKNGNPNQEQKQEQDRMLLSLRWIGRILYAWYEYKNTFWKYESQDTTLTEMKDLLEEISKKSKDLPELLKKERSEDKAKDWIPNNSSDKEMYHRIYCVLGLIYAYGDFGFQKDYKLACEYLQKSFEGGNRNAPYYLGRFYEKGWVEGGANYEEAMKWYKKAATYKNHNAMTHIGKLYEKYALQNKKDMEFYKDKAKIENHIDKIDEKSPLQNKKDTGEWQTQKKRNNSPKVQWYEKAMKWYKKAATYKNHNAMTYIAKLYEKGRGVEQNYPEAMRRYQEATAPDLSNHEAMTHIGKLYEKGWVEGGEPNYKKAMWWYQKAAAPNLNNHKAMNNIGKLYEKGWVKGGEPNYEKAMWWYHKSAALRNHKAMNNIGEFYKKAWEKDRKKEDYEEAMEWFLKAKDFLNYDAIYNIGELYKHQKNLDDAMAHFKKAANQSDAKAIADKSKKTIKEIGDEYQKKGTFSKAKTCFTLARDAKSLFKLGELYERRGNSDCAEECYEEARKLLYQKKKH